MHLANLISSKAKFEKLEAEATAYQQLAGEQTSLEEEFKNFLTSTDVDSELLALKAKMGLLPDTDKDEEK